MNMGQIENELYGDLENDEDLEAELLALQGEDNPVPKKSPQRGPNRAAALSDIDRMAAECMRDIGSDEEVSDTDDPDLLAELQDLEEDDTPAPAPSPSHTNNSAQTPVIKKPEVNIVSVLDDRLSMYKTAMENAKSAGDGSKQRRLDRGIKSIQDLMKKAKANKPISEDDIPPPVALGAPSRGSSPANTPASTKPPPSHGLSPNQPASLPQQPSQPAQQPSQPAQQPQSSTSQKDDDTKKLLHTRRDQYKKAALDAKHAGDMANAKKYAGVAKQFDNVISALEEGKEIDLSKMPPPPPSSSGSNTNVAVRTAPTQPKVQRSSMQAAGETTPDVVVPPPPSAEEEKKIFGAPEAPRNAMEALQQRLQKYQQTEAEAKEKGEGSKARRYSRIVKQYQDAIKAVKAGRAFDFDELPTPPGFAPIPTGGSPAKSPSSSQTTQNAAAGAPVANQRLQPPGSSPQKQRTPSPSRKAEPAQPPQQPQQQAQKTPQRQTSRNSLKKSPTSRAEQQAYFLTDRMNEYKQAALKAKRSNNIELAKKYIRIAKGFEPMIEAAESGLPVDMSKIPPSLEEEAEPSTVLVDKAEVELSGDRTEVFKKLEQDLIKQIRTCATNQQHFTKLGDVMSAAKFEKMEQGCRKELDALKNAFKHNDPVPKFHYENRTFSMVQCNTDLGENDLEITVVRGIQFSLPDKYSEKDFDTFVKLEFPFPTDDPQTGQTDTSKGSCNPEYNTPIKVEISRKSRAFARVVERKSCKFEIYHKRGFLKSDKLIGTANVKLQPLDNLCTVHDSYDLTDGRRAVGGKLEVKIRIRDPFKSKQVEEVKEKWLVIDQFIKTIDKAPQPPRQAVSKSHGTTCIEVLKYEKQQLDLQISSLKGQLSADQTKALVSKSHLIQQKMEQQQEELKRGGLPALKSYARQVIEDLPSYEEEARHLAKLGDMHKAQVMLTKKKHAEKEKIQELEQNQITMMEAQHEYKREISGLRHELEQMKTSVVSEKPAHSLCDYSCKMDMAEIKGRLDGIESRYSNKSKRLLSDDVVGQSSVAFYAHLSASHPHTGFRQPIVFETDVTNVGNAYEPKNGIFIAPVAGVYAFFWNVLNDHLADIHTSLASSQGSLGNTYTSRSTGATSEGSGFAIVHLNQGTHVWVEKEEGFGDFLQVFSSFSGFLLYKDM
ncbi:hypothetical protein FSP39_009170 [Pinctada imbricata]|uniref:C2 domain-containing protein n=1 Tax=Pinctada imbricata TaxID=66713 RepID=A0AA88XTE3_PINIB|nr:hypothetical protein FSP39_009170 [Pinctada imbricata]